MVVLVCLLVLLALAALAIARPFVPPDSRLPWSLLLPLILVAIAVFGASLDIRNFSIIAHIDHGKSTLADRLLERTGAISEREMREQVLDTMDLERERGITIKAQSVRLSYRADDGHDYVLNLIDTPGHVDFTIEVERALKVLDGAVLVLCAVAGVQSQSITVERQMRRYGVPRIAFVNKCDRSGANPARVTDQLREKLKHNAVMMQIPIGLEDKLEGVVDLVTMRAFRFEGENGETINVSATRLTCAMCTPTTLCPIAPEATSRPIS